MIATLSQSDAERFTIFIDTAIDSPRFTLSDFCKAAKLTADQATAWLTRPDIAATLESCIGFVAAAARLRQIVLDTNAMGALGELLHTSKDQIEVRRAATTIISRHKADLRPSRPKRPPATDTDCGPCDPTSPSKPLPPVEPPLSLNPLADTLRLGKEPVPLNAHSTKSILNRAGAPTSLSRDRPR